MDNVLRLGIQGGKGSFNEDAAIEHLKRTNTERFEIIYLHTTEAVLKSLSDGNIDLGQFAIKNSLGGIVAESAEAMARYAFDVVEEFSIKIVHTLLIRSDACLTEIETVMTHPQVLKQCANSLRVKYSHINLTSGEGNLIDHAHVAELLSEKKLPKSTATMGSRRLSDIYDLKLVDENLQDSKENYTSFLWVKRPS